MPLRWIVWGSFVATLALFAFACVQTATGKPIDALRFNEQRVTDVAYLWLAVACLAASFGLCFVRRRWAWLFLVVPNVALALVPPYGFSTVQTLVLVVILLNPASLTWFGFGKGPAAGSGRTRRTGPET
jgi:hypothetical protein